MDHTTLDGMINDLEALISKRRESSLLPAGEYFETPTEFMGFVRNDWRPVFDRAKEVQAGFNSKVRYPSLDERQSAWVRFNTLRSEAHELASKEREKFVRMSEYFRDEILKEAHQATYDPVTDIIFAFDPADAETLRQLGVVLKSAGRALSERKHCMRAEHKTECFEAITEARKSHDVFWSRFKQEKEARRQRWEQNRSEITQKIERNIAANYERLRKIRDAMVRNEHRIEEVQDKLSETTSDKWLGIFSEWLGEALEKRSELSASEETVEGWIREEESRLRDL